MSRHLTRELIANHANVVTAPVADELRQPVQVDRSFEMPTGLYVATAAGYLAFLAILVSAFASPGRGDDRCPNLMRVQARSAGGEARGRSVRSRENLRGE